MKRSVAKVVVFLLLGAIVNVAVAWATVAWAWKPGSMARLQNASARVSPSQTVDVMLEENATVTLVFVIRRASQHLVRYQHNPVGDPFSLAPDWVGLELISSAFESAFDLAVSPTENVEHCMLLGSGWPFQSVKCQLSRTLTIGHELKVHEEISGGIPIAPRGTPEYAFKVLPFIPIWPGFAINTIFYAAVLWLVFAMPFVVRRRTRIKRGLCPACAYPTWGGGTSPVCTECGNTVNQMQPRRGDGM